MIPQNMAFWLKTPRGLRSRLKSKVFLTLSRPSCLLSPFPTPKCRLMVWEADSVYWNTWVQSLLILSKL
jgi:hypothetical protein